MSNGHLKSSQTQKQTTSIGSKLCTGSLLSLALTGNLWGLPVSAEKAQALSALAQLPVKEVTAFKDGHAFVFHEGSMPVDSNGNVLLDYLPTPVLGTFWPFSADNNAKLTAVVASQHKVRVPRSALRVRDFVEANPGAPVEVTESKNPHSTNASTLTYEAQIIGIPVRSSEELEATAPPNSGEKLPEFGDCVLLKTTSGVATVPLENIQYITFKSSYESKLSQEEFRNLLTLKLDWGKGQPAKTAEVGMTYLEKGIRWIPEYKVNIDGSGNAHVKLQATIVNDLTDLKDVNVHLVVGVPTFSFKDQTDPISLQQTLAAVAARTPAGYYGNNALSNSIMSQTAGYASVGDDIRVSSEGEQPGASGVEKNEDLFVFTVKHVTLRKGQRMALPIYETDLKYKDVYTITVPFSPPAEIVQAFNQTQQSELDRLMRAPKYMHKIRLANKSDYPLTTAPALLLKNDKVLAQGMMKYTSAGGSEDLALTTAVDLKVKKQDHETKRTPNAVSWQNDQYGRVDLAGTISTTNYGKEPAEIEVTRYVLGKTGSADHEAKMQMVNIFEDFDFVADGSNPYPTWWSWYSWPQWWSRFNGVGKITWHQTIKPKETLDLNYNWNYFWR